MDRMETPVPMPPYDGDTDTESEDWEVKNDPIPNDPLVDQFEEAVNKWKKRNLLSMTEKSQDPAILTIYTKRCRDLYNTLKVFFEAGSVSMANQDVEEFLPWLQDIVQKDPSTRYAMENIVQRDLLVYPYILNKEHSKAVNADMRKKVSKE